MAIYTTFFACSPAHLAGGFPHWREPLAVARAKEFRNPLTRQRVQIMSREPTWEDEEWTGSAEPKFRAVEITGDYGEYLERRIPAFVRGCAHWCWKGLTQIELDELSRALGVDESSMDVALYAHPSASSALHRLNPRFVERLTQLDQAGSLDVACRWATAMSGPENTSSGTGELIAEPWPRDYAMQLLKELKTLAVKADGKLGVYLLTEW